MRPLRARSPYHRNFRLLWLGALTSSIGTWMQKVAQAWLIVTLTGSSSAFYLGLDSFAGEVPILLFTLIGGVVADRRDQPHDADVAGRPDDSGVHPRTLIITGRSRCGWW
jgi:hypothetical protein